MPVLKIRNAAGSSENRVLSKDQPLAIGRHSSNDIQVDEDGVATLHCRISWSGKGFQIASANSAGVIVNNQLTFRADLEEGDQIRVGSLEIRYSDKSTADDMDEIPLKESRTEMEAVLYGEKKPVATGTPPRGNPVTPPEKDLALTGEIIQEDVPPPIRKKNGKKDKKSKNKPDNPLADSLDELFTNAAAAPAQHPNDMEPVPLPRFDRKGPPLFTLKPVRPGERDLSRSPLVMTLGIGSVLLVLIAGTLYFLVGRETTAQAFDRGMNEFKQKRYSVAIERFQEFLDLYPRHELTKSAVAFSNLSKVEQVLAGTTPDWKRALELLQLYTRSIRELPNSNEMIGYARDAAQRIALGSAEAAGALKKQELIQVSKEAAQALEMSSPADQRPADKLKQIEDAQVKALRLIRRFEYVAASVAKIGSSLDQKQTLPALQEYQRLLDEYPDAAGESDVAAKFQQILEVDKSLVKIEEVDLAAVTTDDSPAFPQIVLLKSTRARADLVESGANIFALIGSGCYAVDSGTGAVRWKRTVGSTLPFTPIPLTSNVLCLLAYDTRRNELILIQQRDGKLVWRLPVKERILGTPLIHEGRILCFSNPSTLLQIDLASGHCSRKVEFPQPLAGSPVLIADNEQLVVVGRQQFTYLLNARSLECLSVVQTRQRDGAIQSSPITLGHFVLYPEIDRTDSTQLNVWDFTKGPPKAPQGTGRVAGHVRDQAVLRGKQLFVPSSGEQVTSFTVSDLTGTPLLTRAGTYQVPNGGAGGATFLKPGSEDELWMGSSLLQRLELSVNSIVPGGGAVAIGATTQPLQLVDQDLVVVGHPKGARSFVMIAADRRQMVGRWQLLFGSSLAKVRLSTESEGRVSLLADTGDLYEFDLQSFENSKNRDLRPIASLPERPEGYGDLQAVSLSNQGFFITAGLPEPQWWLLNAAGQMVTNGKLPESPQTPPISFAEGVVLAFNGKLSYLNPANPKRRIEDFIMPQGDGAADPWVDLKPLDQTRFIATSRSGRLSRFQLQSEPKPHLFEVSNVDRKLATSFSPVLSGEQLYIASAETLERWNSSTWEREWNVTLPEGVSASPQLLGDFILVETGGNRLIGYRHADGQQVWETPLESPIAGQIVLWKNSITVPLASGVVLSIPQEGNPEGITRWDAGRNLAGTTLLAQDSLLLAGDDGSWIRIDQLPGGNP